MKSYQEGTFSEANIFTYKFSGPEEIKDTLLASLPEIDTGKSMVVSMQHETTSSKSNGTVCYTTYPIIKSDGIYARSWVSGTHADGHRIEIQPFYWKIIEFY